MNLVFDIAAIITTGVLIGVASESYFGNGGVVDTCKDELAPLVRVLKESNSDLVKMGISPVYLQYMQDLTVGVTNAPFIITNNIVIVTHPRNSHDSEKED